MSWFIILLVIVLIASASARRRRSLWRMRDFEEEALRSLPRRGEGPGAPPPAPPAARTPNLGCTSCGAKAGGADISPKGEVKCPYCGAWFDAYR